jgi:alkaline phosphatase
LRNVPAAFLLTFVSIIGWAQNSDSSNAKNVILFIADGWGYNHITAAEYYAHGKAGTSIYNKQFDRLPTATFPHERSYDEVKAWTDFDYFKKSPTDSAAAATAMATGKKTVNGRIGMDPDEQRLETITEHAEGLGKSTGLVTSVLFCHATPACYAAHVKSRKMYHIIAEQLIRESAVDVIMGSGHPYYDDNGDFVATKNDEGLWEAPGIYRTFGGRRVWEGLTLGEYGSDANRDGIPDPWTFIESREQFQALVEGDTPARVFGLAQVAGTLQAERTGKDEDLKDDVPGEIPFLEHTPRLVEMTRGALNVLDNNPAGFFLMVEGGAVDWASHGNRGGRMIEELMDFNRSVEAAAEWVEVNSSWDETLIIVTGDHECGYLCGPDSDPEWKPIVNNGIGKMPGLAFYSGSHTNQLIPTYVKGAGAGLLKSRAKGNDPKRGPYIDNTDIGQVMFEALK